MSNQRANVLNDQRLATRPSGEPRPSAELPPLSDVGIRVASIKDRLQLLHERAGKLEGCLAPVLGNTAMEPDQGALPVPPSQCPLSGDLQAICDSLASLDSRLYELWSRVQV